MPLRRILAGCAIVALVVLLVAGCAVAGSLQSGTLPEVDFGSDEITAARDSVIPVLDAELDAVERRSGFEPVGPRGRRSRCDEGQDNFTRQDEYAYTCRVELVQLVAVPEPFRENASRLGEALLDGECPDGTDTDRVLAAEPLDEPPNLTRSTGDCTPGFRYRGPEIVGWLPAEPTADELERANVVSWPQCRSYDVHCEADPADLGALVPDPPSGAAWIAIVADGDTYYTAQWDCPWPKSWFAESCAS